MTTDVSVGGPGPYTNWTFALAGLQGIQGVQGQAIQGATGTSIQGATGLTGPQGAQGTYYVAPTASIPTGVVAGNTWVNTDDGRLYVYDGTEWFEPYDNLQGIQGIQGIQGPIGQSIQGATGPQGIGLTGLQSAGVVYGSSTGSVQQTLAGTAGQLLMSYGDITAGGPEWVSIAAMESVAVATTGALQSTGNAAGTGTWTYNGAAAPATLTAGTANVAAVIDGYTLLAGDRVLIKNQAAGAQNGVYLVSTIQSAGAPIALSRDNDSDTMSKIAGIPVSVDQGTTNGGTGWSNTNKTTDTLGSQSITYYQMINSNNPVFTGTVGLPAGTTLIAPLQMTSGGPLNTAAIGNLEYASPALYFTPTASGRGVIPSNLFAMTPAAGTTYTSNLLSQKIWATPTTGALTLATNTTYLFEALVKLTITTTGGAIQFSLQGTSSAQFVTNGVMFNTIATDTSSGTTATTRGTFFTSATGGTVTTTLTGTAPVIFIKGMFTTSTNASTIIPSLQFTTTAPGTSTVSGGSFITLTPIAASGTNQSGAWA